MVVDDLKVSYGFSLGGSGKVHVQLGLAGSLGQHREVSGLPNFHTWSTHPEMVVRDGQPPNPSPAQPSPAQTTTCAIQPRALCLDLAGIVGWVHLDMEGAGGDLLEGGKAWSGWTLAVSEKSPLTLLLPLRHVVHTQEVLSQGQQNCPQMTASQAAGWDEVRG